MKITFKRAEVTGQMFMYIAAAIIAAVILIIGVNAIVKLTTAQKDASDRMFSDSLNSYFESVNSLGYNSERVKDFKIISDFKTVCFISRNAIKSASINTGYPEIDNAVLANSRNNVYLLSSKTTKGFEVSDISSFSASLFSPAPAKEYYCKDIVNGKITLKLRAKGDSVEIVNVI